MDFIVLGGKVNEGPEAGTVGRRVATDKIIILRWNPCSLLANEQGVAEHLKRKPNAFKKPKARIRLVLI